MSFSFKLLAALLLIHPFFNDMHAGEDTTNYNGQIGTWICFFNDFIPKDILEDCKAVIDTKTLMCPSEHIKAHLIEHHHFLETAFCNDSVIIQKKHYPLHFFIRGIPFQQEGESNVDKKHIINVLYICKAHKKFYKTKSAYRSLQAHYRLTHSLTVKGSRERVLKSKLYYCSCSENRYYKTEQEAQNHVILNNADLYVL